MTDTARTEWLAWRKTGVTATDAPAIVGLSNYSSPYKIWATKVGLIDDGTDDPTDAMRFGKYVEPGLARWFMDDTPGLYVVGEQMWCTHPDDPWRLATIDGAVTESPASSLSDALGGFEIKTTSDTADEWDAQIPNYVAAQVQWQMAVTGLERTWLATLHTWPRLSFRVRVIERDPGDVEFLIRAARRFWHDNVLAGVPPEVDGSESTTDALRAAYRGDVELDAVEASPELLTAQARILANKERVKACEAIIATEENRIRAALGDHTALTSGVDAKGRPNVLATWKPGQRSTFDIKRALAEMPDLSVYQTSTPTRTLLVKPIKQPKQKAA